MRKKIVLITGSSGHLGSQLASLLQPIFNVMTLSRSDKKATLHVDISKLSQPDIESIYKNYPIDAVIHCAGITNPKTEEDVSFNAYSFTKFLTQPHVRHVLIGSVSEYGFPKTKTISEKTPEHPITSYGVSKLLQKRVASYFYFTHKTDIVYFRVSNIIMPYGRQDSLIESIFRASQKPKEKVQISSRAVSRDFIDIRDLSNAIQMAVLAPTHDFLYNLCSGRRMTYDTFIDTFREEWEKTQRSSFPSITYTGMPENYYPGRYSTLKIKKTFGWKTHYSLRESLHWLIQKRNG
ncbi:MAG: NAD(P)-dependent oxidoreductase [Microgenomates group bacterium]